MPRVPDDELGRLKDEVSVRALVEARGIELKKHGADLVARCPFHADKTPSLVVSPSKNLWHCMGACQTGGSVIDWVMKAEGVSFRHAVEILREGAPTRRRGEPRLPAPVEPNADDRAAVAQVIDYYHRTLKESPEALAYLEKRGVRSAEAIEHFKLGYANRTLGFRLPPKRGPGGEIREQLQRVGVLRETGYEHLAGCLVMPIFDEGGQIVEVHGRRVRDDLSAGTVKHVYLPGPHRGVWNWEALKGSRTVILCEALLDALTFWCAGFRNVTSAYGVEGFTAEMLEAFRRHGVEQALIAFDRDEAGDRGAAKVAKQLIEAGVSCYRVQFPKDMDANEYARRVQPAGKSLELVLRKAVLMGRGNGRDDAEPVLPAPAVAPTVVAVESTPAAAGGGSAAAATPEVSAAAPPTVVGARPNVAAELRGDEVHVALGDRKYRVRGLAKNTSFDALKVNLLAARGEAFFVDTLDLYSARARAAYLKQAALELGVNEDVMRADLGKVLLKLEELHDAQVRDAMAPKEPAAVKLTDAEESVALELLRDPRLCDRIVEDFRRCGVVGEETNKLCGYLAAVSRKLDEPLAVIIQSSSAAGKSSLMDAVLAFVPDEDRVKYSAMTGQSLFYMQDGNLRHKILAVVEEEGASRASYALKILQSEGELTIASTGKDPETGKLVTQEYHVEGPVMIFLTTTAMQIDEELLNRCLVLTVDEDRGQTHAIHELQRAARELEGRLAKKSRDAVLKVHRDAQRLLRPLLVVNPYARELTFPDHRTRTRRDHVKYLTLIDTLALLHQHQRPVKTVVHEGQAVEYVEVTLDDIATANRIAHQVLGRSLDELAPQTRRMLSLLDRTVASACERLAMQRSDFRFTRKEVRDAIGWTDFQVRTHLDRLVELEYVLAHRGGRGQSFVYELLYDGKGQDGSPFVMGLVDVEALRGRKCDQKFEPPKPEYEGSTSPHRGANEPPSSPGRDRENARDSAAVRPVSRKRLANGHPGTKHETSVASADTAGMPS